PQNCHLLSPVSSALANTKDRPGLFDYFEDTELYRKQADKALEKYKRKNDDFAFFRVDRVERVVRVRGEERTNYYVDFSVRNCSSHHFPRHATEHRNISDVQAHLDHLPHSGGHEHSPAGKPSFKPKRSRDSHHPHKPHQLGCPPPLEDKNHADRPQFQSGAPPVLPPSRCHHPHFGTNGTHTPLHNHSSSEHHPHGHHPHDHHPHGHRPHGHHLHGHHPHGHHPHGYHPHGHHPHGQDFHDHGPCDPPPYSQSSQDHHRWGHGPPPRHSEERGPGKRHFPFKWRQIGYVYRLPPLKKGEVLPLPEANFPIFSLPNHNNPLKREIQPFPQSASESCPGTFKSEFPQVLTFFAYTFPKKI
uniref:Histidine rich glycoprotein n=1 Tax=Rhinolophus ferrumequinum TaxID=59479 RepID=A0A671F2R6_RHIFE